MMRRTKRGADTHARLTAKFCTRWDLVLKMRCFAESTLFQTGVTKPT